MSLAPLICPFCGSVGLSRLPNKKPQSKLITPYYCTHCQRTVESGPIQLPQKASPSDLKPKRKRKRNVE